MTQLPTIMTRFATAYWLTIRKFAGKPVCWSSTGMLLLGNSYAFGMVGVMTFTGLILMFGCLEAHAVMTEPHDEPPARQPAFLLYPLLCFVLLIIMITESPPEVWPEPRWRAFFVTGFSNLAAAMLIWGAFMFVEEEENA